MTTTRTVAVAFLAALALTACGGSDPATRTGEPVGTSPSAGGATSASAAPNSPAGPVVSFAPDDAAVASFGEQRVRDALSVAQTVANAATANQDLLDAEKDTADEIVGAVDRWLTSEARTRLAATAATIPSDGTQSKNVAVQLVTAAYGSGDLSPVAPYLSAWTASDFEVSLDADGRLVVDLVVKADVLYVKAGQPITYPVTRRIAYTMVPSPNGKDDPSWLVDDWASTTSVGDPR